jgi:CcmD family protein
MDPTNKELYTLVLADAPYVVAAYAVLWVALCVYVTMVLRRIMRLEKEIVLLEDATPGLSAGEKGE